jgi:hypothetical protein
MKRQTLVAALIALTAALQIQAGTLAGGRWTPSGCGAAPVPPAIDSGSVDAYNRSLETARAWQRKAQGYNDCVVGEANADNAAIAEAANAEQARFRAAVEQTNGAAAAAKAKLDHR